MRNAPQVHTVSTSAQASHTVGAGVIWALGAVFFWSQSTACLKIILQSTSWITLAFWATTFAAVCYFLLVLVTGRMAQLRAMPAKELLTVAGIGISGCFIYTCFNYAAFACGPAAEVLIVNYLWPVATVGFASLLSRERPGIREICGLLLAVLGVICVVTRGHFQMPGALLADCLALSGALFYGLFSAASKRVSGDRILILFITYASSSILFLFTALFTHSQLRVEHTTTWLLLGYQGLCLGAVPTLFWLKALQAQSTSRAAIIVYLTPALGLVWLKILLPSEQITPAAIGGFLLIAGGFLLQLARRPTASPHAVSSE